jgi:hypothetical protein
MVSNKIKLQVAVDAKSKSKLGYKTLYIDIAANQTEYIYKIDIGLSNM